MAYIKTVTDYLAEQAKESPDHVLLTFIDYDERAQKWVLHDHTVEETYHRSLEIAYMLRRRGLRPGDRAIIFSMQDYGTMYAVYGCMMAGVVFTVIPPPIDEDKADRFLSVLTSCHPRALISNYALEQESDVSLTGRLLREATADTLRLKRIYTDKLYPYRREDVIVPARPDGLAYLQYTSGSTSAPKGARVLWKNVMKNLEQCWDCVDFNGVTLATWVPFFHNLGLVITICTPPLSRGSRGFYFPTPHFLENPKLWLKLVSDYQIALTVGPGSAYDACTRIFSKEEAKELRLSQVTHFMNGSEYISPANVARFYEMFDIGPNAMAPGYGVAENCCLATVANQDYRTLHLDYEAYRENRIVLAEETDNDDRQVKEIVSVGRPVKDLTVVIANPKTRKTYPDLRIGEIFLAGDSVVDGYWGDHPENKNFHQKLSGYDLDFYRTGDLGFMYEGNLYITGRAKEMIIFNGHNFYPSDLQTAVMRGVPALAGSAFGSFSCHIGEKEQVVAVVEARPTENFRQRIREINTVVSDRFGFSFYDIVFVPVDTIPRTDNRKLQVLKARRLYLDGKLHVLYSSRDYYTKKESEPTADPSVDAADDQTDLSGQQTDNLSEKLTERTDEIFNQVRSSFQKLLKIDQFNPNESFLSLGGDSLMGFELVNNIEERFHIELDLRELLRDSSVIGITKYVHSVLGDARVASKTKPVNLANECRLDEDIRFAAKYDKPASECNTILLTGATGFLGAYLIRAIFHYYPHSGLRIYCLVRAGSGEAAMKRIKDNLKHYHIWHDSMESYLHPVCGDISEPHLGVSDEEWEELSTQVEVIYHNAALLNFIYPYEYLKVINVDGTAETLRLASEGRAKYYHYVSSYSVYDTPGNEGERLMEDARLDRWLGFSLAYSETKWVSEKLVKAAGHRGLKAAIYRPGDITGAANGIWDMNDMISRMIVSTIQMQAIPLAAYRFHMTPVDYVANAMIYISRKEECFGHAFNLINPRDQGFATVIGYIRSCGYRVRYVPFRIWKNQLKKANASENAMVLLESLFETGDERYPSIVRHFIGIDPVYDMSNARLLLSQSGIRCRPVDEKMIRAYLKYFRSQGLIP
ncbi:MAG: thioester reductase domain-containing protein [Lachnospiraceae bacterium]|nr:thioester reductase domain-containing protein [Lachnospiraceae bacterium]